METNYQSALKDVLKLADSAKGVIESVRSVVSDLGKNVDMENEETKKAVNEAKEIFDKIDSNDGLESLEKAFEKLKNIQFGA